MEFINDLLAIKGAGLSLIALVTLVIGRVIKIVPWKWLEKALFSASFGLGVLVSTRGNRVIIAKLYNSTIEPLLKFLLRTFLGAIVGGFVKGLESDDPQTSYREEKNRINYRDDSK